MENCLFTDEKLNEITYITTPSGHMTKDLCCNCPTCGRYIISDGILRIFENRGKSISKQSKTNCASQCIKFGMDNPSQLIFWVVKGEGYACEQRHENNEHYAYFDFEDFENEFVDHAEKPFVLLKMVASRLSGKGAIETYKITKKDWIISKITSDEELKQYLEFLLKKKLS